ncbi:hypothetical protein ACQZ46_02430 [Agrobacterium salinitolerans]
MADTVKHTEGPWSFQYTDESGECFVIAQNLGGLVGAALPWPTEIDSRDFRRVIANARLIAAAPDLLKAAKHSILALEIEFGRSATEVNFHQLYAAIAKAEGRS